MKTSPAGIDLIHAQERYREFAYPDPGSALHRAAPRAGWGFRPARLIIDELSPAVGGRSGSPWTCGWGETRGVTIDTRMSRAEADRRFAQSLAEFEQAVRKAVAGARTTQAQFDAMVSFAYNIGTEGFMGSTVLRQHLAGNSAAAARAFGLWNKSKGRQMDGLVARRAAEAALYLSDVHEPVPALVEPERDMAHSEIVRASTVGGVAATAAGAAEVLRAVRDTADSLGPTVFIIAALVVVVAVALYTIHKRRQQRTEGWA